MYNIYTMLRGLEIIYFLLLDLWADPFIVISVMAARVKWNKYLV